MSEDRPPGAKRFQPSIVVDTHVHAADYLPRYAASAFRWINRRTVPPLFFFNQLPAAGVDVIVANAVGDWPVTAWRGQSPWRAIERQLSRIEAQARQQGVAVVLSTRHILQAFESRQPAVLLGLEGGNAIGTSLAGGRAVPARRQGHDAGSSPGQPDRHYVPALAALCRASAGSKAPGPRADRIWPQGDQADELARDAIDVSHSDTATLHDILALSTQPVLATHSGAKRVENFERFLDDDESSASPTRAG